MIKRASYDESCLRLRELGLLAHDEVPLLPARRPRYDDDQPWGLNFFRTFIEGPKDLSNLTLPRTFFGRSEIRDVSFQGTDLRESTLCWNDFVAVDFRSADLSLSDLRSACFDDVQFAGAILRRADLRRSSFAGCRFDSAVMQGAVLTRAQASRMSLSTVQQAEIDWRDEDGEEPGGG